MTLAQFAEATADTCGMSDAESVLIIKRSISRRVRMLYDSQLWRDALVLVTKTASAAELVMPAAIERVVAVRWDSQMIYPVDAGVLFQYDAQIFDRTGQPMLYSDLTPVALGVLPTAAEQICGVSTSSADVDLPLLLRGEDSAGAEQAETVLLNGTSAASCSQVFLLVTTAAKAITAGTVTIRGLTSGTLFQTLWPEESERKHPRIRLHEAPSDATKSLLILGKRRFRPMTSDLDTPLLRGLDNAILSYARADEWKRQRQYTKSSAEAQEAGAQVQIALSLEKDQGAAIARIVPWEDGNDQLALDGYAFSGKGSW